MNVNELLKGNFKVQQTKSSLFPLFGPWYLMYSFFFTFHKLVIAFYIPFKAAFEGEPTWASVYFDFYLDLVFFLDILTTFNMPLYDQK